MGQSFKYLPFIELMCDLEQINVTFLRTDVLLTKREVREVWQRLTVPDSCPPPSVYCN